MLMLKCHFDNFGKNFTFNDISSKDRTDFMRTHILASLKKVSVEAYNAFNFRAYDFPDVIYQKPYKNNCILYLKKSGEAIKYKNELILALFNNPFFYKDKKVSLQGIPKPIDDILIAPREREDTERVKYNIITPLILFASKEKFPIYYSIVTNNNEHDAKEILKEKCARLIRENMKYQLNKLVGWKKYDYLDDIDINWENFDIRFIEYHKGERKTPAIFGNFTSSWDLPRFIGQKIGKGFGQINRAKNFNEGKK